MKCRGQQGAGSIFLVAVLLLATLIIAAIFLLSRISSSLNEQAETARDLENISAALEQFAAATGRLPCPADPTLDLASDTGGEAINGTSCKAGLAGTIPWKTIGLDRGDSFDAWGWRISYRVYSAAVGGFTQPIAASSPTNGGASMVNCNTNPRFDAGVDANGFCNSNYLTSIGSFTAGKGLTVKQYTDVSGGAASAPSSTLTGVAYVLISHGQTGFGGYTASGARRDLPDNGPEHDNTDVNSNSSPFVVSSSAPASGADIPPSKKGHFDDLVLYRTIVDLVRRTGLSARPWSFSQSLQAVLGTPVVAGGSLGVSTLDLGGTTVSSSGGQISYEVVGGNEGLGVASGGSIAINGSESMSVTFSKSAQKFAITLNDFGGTTFPFFGFFPETAALKFYRNGSLLYSTTVSGCQNSVTGGGPLASFTVDPGVTFDQVQITPFFSSFFLSAVKSCASTDSTCLTALDNGLPPSSSGNHCDWP
jgi:type II secretory pathway pseudopilin PulG